jgi:hypothetical protein
MYEPTTMGRIAVYIVVKDGSGDFSSIQQAIDAIPGGSGANDHFAAHGGIS